MDSELRCRPTATLGRKFDALTAICGFSLEQDLDAKQSLHRRSDVKTLTKIALNLQMTEVPFRMSIELRAVAIAQNEEGLSG
jgi:hypothetical protein